MIVALNVTPKFLLARLCQTPDRLDGLHQPIVAVYRSIVLQHIEDESSWIACFMV